MFGGHLPQYWMSLLPTLQKPSRLHRVTFRKVWTFCPDRKKTYNVGRSIVNMKC
jgi:hypothetical protein